MTDAPIAGWYPDPRNTDASWRWWNGRDWTHETAARHTAAAVAEPAPLAGAPEDFTSHPCRIATVTSEVPAPSQGWTWFMVFGTFAWSLFAAVFQVIGIVVSGFTPEGDTVTSAQLVTMLTVTAVAWVLAVVPMLVFAGFDRRDLTAHGVSAPSGLLMFLFPNIVYYLVRRSRLGRAGVRFRAADIVFFVINGSQVVSVGSFVVVILAMLPVLVQLDMMTR
ncbi:hypothetical protein BH09ACT5_BH09ACT5_21080 [soil metagenome]